jgi:hypothetical protein
MMSPHDLAHLIRGAELLTDMYDDPDGVHRVLRLTTDLFLKAAPTCRASACCVLS